MKDRTTVGEARVDYSPEFLVELLRRLSLTSARHVSRIAKKMGISFTEVVALHLLRDSGDLTVNELASLMFLTPGAVTQLADRLERAGYLERIPNPADRRSLLLRVTRAGKETAWRQMGPFKEEIRGGIAGLSAQEREMVGRTLECVLQALDPPTEEEKG